MTWQEITNTTCEKFKKILFQLKLVPSFFGALYFSHYLIEKKVGRILETKTSIYI